MCMYGAYLNDVSTMLSDFYSVYYDLEKLTTNNIILMMAYLVASTLVFSANNLFGIGMMLIGLSVFYTFLSKQA